MQYEDTAVRKCYAIDLRAGSWCDEVERSLAQLAADAGPLRRELARIAQRFVATDACDRLGFARLGDYTRERLGLSARELQDLARVDVALAELPRVDAALCSGGLGWTKVRLLCRFATARDEAFWLAAAERFSAAGLASRVRRVEREAAGLGASGPELEAEEDARIETLRIPCAEHVPVKWGGVRRLVRRVTGAWVPFAECAEHMAAEVISALPLELEPDASASAAVAARPEPLQGGTVREALPETAAPSRQRDGVTGAEHGPPPCGRAPHSALIAELRDGLAQADASELDRRLRRAVALERGLLCRMGPLLAEVADGRLYRDLGLRSLDAYARERLGVAPRKARALLRVERACRRSRLLRAAWQRGSVSWSQAQALVAIVQAPGSEPFQAGWLERALRVTVRRLEDDVDRALTTGELDPAALPPLPEPVFPVPAGVQTGARPMAGAERSYIRIGAPPEVVRWFRACLAVVRLRLERARGRPATPGEAFEAMCDHVLDAWTEGERALSRRQRREHAIFERDGWRCTMPGCRSYANLHEHHVRFRSRGGSDAPENRTTLCAFHHLRAVHGGRVRITGCAPAGLRYEMPLGSWTSGDVRC
jgi:hypothetical protein